MRNRFLFVLNLTLLLYLYSCKTYKPLVTNQVPAKSVTDYVNSFKDLAVTEMKRTGIPASITLAQGIIESDCGNSSLARMANNHFGIKCHNDWTGSTIRHHDNKRNECFRKYDKPSDSFYDHSDFLKSTSRYSFLFSYNSADYKAWARGLKKAGYATNPDYANMLIRTIEDNKLWYYDNEYKVENFVSQKRDTVKKTVASNSADSTPKMNSLSTGILSVPARVPRVMENNRVKYIIVKDGDNKEKLENEFQLLRWELSRYNELKDDFQPVPGQILYLQPKRDKAEAGKDYYTSVQGDTMYLISQHYAIKLKKLYEMNRMNTGDEPVPGKKIWLRSIKPVE